MIHFVFCVVGFTWFTLCFAFGGGDLHDSHRVLCFWIHMIHFVFCVLGFTLCFASWGGIYMIHTVFCVFGFTWFTLFFVFLDSQDSRCVFGFHDSHFVCVAGFTRFTLCFRIPWFTLCLCFWIYMIHNVLCWWIHTIHVVFCIVGFTRFTSRFVLLDSHDLLCALCCFIHIIHLAFRAVGFTRFTLFYGDRTTCVTLSFVPLDSIPYGVLPFLPLWERLKWTPS